MRRWGVCDVGVDVGVVGGGDDGGATDSLGALVARVALVALAARVALDAVGSRCGISAVGVV
eukprot:13255968-Alexandrium_andersonii.AAC.1